MSIVTEIQEVINHYKQMNKGIDRIVVNRKLLNETGTMPDDYDGEIQTLLGYPCKLTDNEFHRFTVQPK